MSLNEHIQMLGGSMLDNWSLKMLLAPVLTILAWSVGGMDALLLYLFILVCLDFLLGLARAYSNSNISSMKLKHGAGKFVMYWIIVAVAVLADKVIMECPINEGLEVLKTFGVTIEIQMRGLVISYLCLTEIISVLEHLSEMGAPVPRFMVSRLRKYKDIYNR